jgi:hypothetical protein
MKYLSACMTFRAYLTASLTPFEVVSGSTLIPILNASNLYFLLDVTINTESFPNTFEAHPAT